MLHRRGSLKMSDCQVEYWTRERITIFMEFQGQSLTDTVRAASVI